MRAVLDEADRLDLADTAELLVSELVTNAVLHAGTEVAVEASVDGTSLRVEVRDGSSHLPSPRAYGRLASTGRGLHLLEALVDQWGVDRDPPGKRIWFELSQDHRPAPTPGESTLVAPGASDSTTEQGGELLRVVLLDVPLLLHAAWQMHAESLLREHLLTRLDEEDAGAELGVHAAIHDAMALLREHIAVPGLGPDPEAVMAGATEPLVSAARVVVPVPAESVANFALLEQSLESAAAEAESGALLTVPMQPELRELRHWLCGQIRAQSAGREPTAWRPDPHLPAPSSPIRDAGDAETSALVAEVAQSAQALIAADDTNRIIALSDAATGLLGYETAEDLVGQRIVTVIPQRYRQAHVAGFTLHLVAGRDPLIGAPVTVPALRADGSEVPIELSISARQLQGRPVFVATMAPV